MWLYVLIAALLAVAIGVQVTYAWANRAQAVPAMKAIMAVNIGMLSALFLGVIWLAYSQAVK